MQNFEVRWWPTKFSSNLLKLHFNFVVYFVPKMSKIRRRWARGITLNAQSILIRYEAVFRMRSMLSYRWSTVWLSTRIVMCSTLTTDFLQMCNSQVIHAKIFSLAAAIYRLTFILHLEMCDIMLYCLKACWCFDIFLHTLLCDHLMYSEVIQVWGDWL